MKLNKSTIDGLPSVSNGQVDYFDESLKGFGIRISKESRTFFVRASVGGKRTRVVIGKYGIITPDQARRKAIDTLAKLQNGDDVNQQKRVAKVATITVSGALETYLADKTDLKDSTGKFYRFCFCAYLADWKDSEIGQITEKMVEIKHAEITTQNGRAAADNVMRSFAAVWNRANLRAGGALGINPVAILNQLDKWNRPERRTRHIPQEKIGAFIDAVNDLDNPVMSDFFLCLLFTGARKNEIAGLAWENVDMESRTFCLKDTKNGKHLTLPMSSPLVELFHRRFESRENEYVFPGRCESHIKNPDKSCRIISEKIGVRFSCHDLRRTFAGIAVSLVSYYELKKLLNHSMTGNDVTAGYVIFEIEPLRIAMQKISDAILSLAK